MRLILASSLLVCASALADSEDALAPPSIEAVQERAYKMSLELNIGVGTAPIDPFTKAYFPSVGAVIHFTDQISWQVARFSFSSFSSPGGPPAFSLNVNSQLRDQLERDFNANPNSFEEIRYFAGSDLIFSPLYGKSTFINRLVVHYEAFIVLGISIFKFSKSYTIPLIPDAPGLNVGAGIRIFHTQHVSYRLDITDTVGTTFKGAYNVLTIQALLAFNLGSTE